MTAWGTSSAADPRRRLLLAGAFASFSGAGLLAALWLRAPSARWPRAPDQPPFHGRDVSAQDWRGAFSLLDPSGQRRTLAAYRGKAVLVTFGYTRCPDACPTTLARLARARQLLGADADKVQVLFVTIDPQRDGPAMLESYVHEFDPAFVALRGSESETDAAARAFRADYRIVEYGHDVLVEHTVDTYLLDPQGQVRVVLPDALSAQDVAEDVHRVLSDAGLCRPWSGVDGASAPAARAHG